MQLKPAQPKPTHRSYPFILLFILLSLAVYAQNPTGTLRGDVQDPSGGRVPSATIAVQAAGSSLRRETKTDDHGEFRLSELLPGTYRVVVDAKGFAEAEADVTVIVSSVRDITVTMHPEAAAETVNVQAQPSSITTQPIDLASAVHQATVSTQDLQTLPLAARSFANIAYLAPGTEPVEPSDPTKARITAVSTGGSSGLNNELSVDGGDNSDDYIGGFLQNFSPDAIQEFAVRTAQEDADTGRTTAGSVVITTKRGTNQWHGGGAFYERDASLNARFPVENPAPNPKQPFSRQNYVGTIGGPIKKDKLWFFSSLEYVHENASIAYSPASQAQFNALASLASLKLIDGITSIPVPPNVPVPFRDYLASTRFDWSQSQKSQWFLRAAIDNYITRNALVQQAALPSTGAEQHNNYMNLVISNQYTFTPTWLGSFVFDASGLHLTEARNSNLGFALAFPFTSTSQTISGFETFGDNQFLTPITAFPVTRTQEKYQFRYDVSRGSGDHAPRFGINFIHEPVLSGALSGTAETLISYANDPAFYAANPAQFYFNLNCINPPADVSCAQTPAGDGSFSQNVQRLGLYAEDSWRATPHLTVNYGLRYDTTFGLLTASGRSQADNPAYLTLKALGIPLINGVAHDYRKAFGPRLGIAYSPGKSGNTVIRAGFGLFYNDLAQTGWVAALQAVNAPPGVCINPGDPGCIPGGAPGAIIDPHYKTPYALHATAGIQHAFNAHWTASADYTHEEGNHAYRAYPYAAGTSLFAPNPADQADVPNVAVFKSDNRSSYNALMLHLQGNVSRRFNLVANYTLARAQTWGCVLGELFDYVNGVCDPLNPFRPGDYGPSGEDVTHRFVLAGTVYVPGGFELTTLTQAESARPFTITLADNSDRILVNGVRTSLDQFRGTPYIQADLRVSRPVNFHDRWSLIPFIEFFNLFNRNNPGANYVTNVSLLPVPQQNGNVTVSNLNQLRVPAGALGDFFGPGTTVGIPFAAQLGVRVTF
ncbi:MAG TPA: carboxypeptidase regulatory-like domain-containing protein [Terriglobales bacterium]|nr:carboxypeptidase regulatory-like domain-containing protein [Terriglobales bacterium]